MCIRRLNSYIDLSQFRAKGLKGNQMNGADREDLKIIIYRLDQQDKFRDELRAEFTAKLGEMRTEMKVSHTDTAERLKFIKENLFNPETGLWA